MSTRSRIGLMYDGKITHIYCHFDGYPEGVGACLVEHWSDETKIRRLLRLGSLSILGSEIGKKQDFNAHYDDANPSCLAYGRDRGEPAEKVKAIVSPNVAEFVNSARGSWGEFVYLFVNFRWFFAPVPPENCRPAFRLLAPYLRKEKKELVR